MPKSLNNLFSFFIIVVNSTNLLKNLIIMNNKKSVKISNSLHKWYKHYSIDHARTLGDVIGNVLEAFREQEEIKKKVELAKQIAH